MAQGNDNHVLQQISINEWESQRVRDVDELAAALTHTVAASSALPRYTQAGQPDLGRAATELRTELRARLNAKSPFTHKARSQRAVAHLQALARECGYDPEGDSSLDALITSRTPSSTACCPTRPASATREVGQFARRWKLPPLRPHTPRA